MPRPFRALRGGIGVIACGIAALAIGVGVSAMALTIVRDVLMRPAPGREPERLVSIAAINPIARRPQALSYVDFEQYRAGAEGMAQMAAFAITPVVIGRGPDATRATGMAVSGSYFAILGASPAAGRWLDSTDVMAAAEGPRAVISDYLWRLRFNRAPDVVGNQVMVNGRWIPIVGVAPASFTGPYAGVAIDVWVPLTTLNVVGLPRADFERPEATMLDVVARLGSSVSRSDLETRLAAVTRRLNVSMPIRLGPRRLSVDQASGLPVGLRPVANGMATFLVLMAALVLVLAAVNISALLLTRGMARRKEIAIRLAIGATRGSIMRLIGAEAAIIAVAALLIGLASSAVAAALLPKALPALPLRIDLSVGLDWQTAAATVVAVSIVIALAALLPALRLSGAGSLDELRVAHDVGGVTQNRVRTRLLAGQLAIALVLLTTAALLTRSFFRAQAAEVGFSERNIVLATMDLGLNGYTPDSAAAFYQRLLQRLSGQPQFRATALAQQVPLGFGNQGIVFRARGGAREVATADYNVVSGRYFDVMGIEILEGRDFAAVNHGAGALSSGVIVNKALARHIWPDASAVGRQISVDGPEGPWREVIGVVATGRYRSIRERDTPYLYLPIERRSVTHATIHARPTGSPTDAIRQLVFSVGELDPNLPVFDIQTLNEHLERSNWPGKIAATFVAGLALVSLVLAVTGVFGSTSYVAMQREREFGIRAALGASPLTLMRRIVGEGLRPVLWGGAAGLLLSYAAARMLRGFLFGVGPTDIRSWALALSILAAAAIAASSLAGRRVVRISPMTALRVE